MTSYRRLRPDRSLVQKIVALVVLNTERDVMLDDFMSRPFDRTQRASAHQPQFNQHSVYVSMIRKKRSLKG